MNLASAAVELARDGLDTGTLVPVVTDFDGLSVPLNAIQIEGRSLPRKIRALFDFAVEDNRRSEVM
jgi:hypothetical protein